MTDGLATLNALASAFAALTARALGAYPPDLADRVAAGASPFGALRFNPLTASVYVEAGGGAFKLGEFAGADLPPGLDEAAAAFVADALVRLAPDAQAEVRALLRSGAAALSVVVNAYPRTAELVLHAGSDRGRVLVRVAADEGRVH